MSMSALLHNAVRMEANKKNDTAWLSIYDAGHDHVTIFMPLPLAEQIAELFENYDDMCDECHKAKAEVDSPYCLSCGVEKAIEAREMREMGEDDRAHAWADKQRGL